MVQETFHLLHQDIRVQCNQIKTKKTKDFYQKKCLRHSVWAWDKGKETVMINGCHVDFCEEDFINFYKNVIFQERQEKLFLDLRSSLILKCEKMIAPLLPNLQLYITWDSVAYSRLWRMVPSVSSLTYDDTIEKLNLTHCSPFDQIKNTLWY